MFKLHKPHLSGSIHSGHFMVSRLDDDDEDNNDPADDTSESERDNANSVEIDINNRESVADTTNNLDLTYRVDETPTTRATKNEQVTSWNDLDRPAKQSSKQHQYLTYYTNSYNTSLENASATGATPGASITAANLATSSSSPNQLNIASDTIVRNVNSAATSGIHRQFPTVRQTQSADARLSAGGAPLDSATTPGLIDCTRSENTIDRYEVGAISFAALDSPQTHKDPMSRSHQLDQQQQQQQQQQNQQLSPDQLRQHQQLQQQLSIHRHLQPRHAVTIDTSLTKLFETMSLYYSSNLTSPKWKSFKGLKLRLKNKIRLNNLIWRTWFLQYIRGRRPPGCRFTAPVETDVHKKSETVVLEGKYWKRKEKAIVDEYKKWRIFHKQKCQLHCFRPSSFDWDSRASNLASSSMYGPTECFYPDYDMNIAYNIDDFPPMLEEVENREQDLYYISAQPQQSQASSQNQAPMKMIEQPQQPPPTTTATSIQHQQHQQQVAMNDQIIVAQQQLTQMQIPTNNLQAISLKREDSSQQQQQQHQLNQSNQQQQTFNTNLQQAQQHQQHLHHQLAPSQAATTLHHQQQHVSLQLHQQQQQHQHQHHQQQQLQLQLQRHLNTTEPLYEMSDQHLISPTQQHHLQLQQPQQLSSPELASGSQQDLYPLSGSAISSGSGGGSGSGRTEQRRVCHINAEQKRRCNIKNGFDTLKSILPSINQNVNVKISKASMLNKAAAYIATLSTEQKQQADEQAMLKQQIENLKSTIRAYQAQLPASGGPVGCPGSSQARDMLQTYVRRRTLENWKFWIFSLLIEPLFETYYNSVSTTSLEDSCKTIFTWLDRSCGLVSLRKEALKSLTFLSTSTNILNTPQTLPTEAVDAVRYQSNSGNGNPNQTSALSRSGPHSQLIPVPTPMTTGSLHISSRQQQQQQQQQQQHQQQQQLLHHQHLTQLSIQQATPLGSTLALPPQQSNLSQQAQTSLPSSMQAQPMIRW